MCTRRRLAHERDDRVKRLAGKIDRVLVDAPCSGLGTLRRNPDMKWRQSPKAVAELQAKQIAILNSAARLVKSGGRLVYATCSLLRDENEVVAEGFADVGILISACCRLADALAAAHVDRAGEPGRRRLPAPVAAPPRHRRLLCCGLAAALSWRKPMPRLQSAAWDSHAPNACFATRFPGLDH